MTNSNPSHDVLRELETELLPKILWQVHQNGRWFDSPIMDKDRNILPKEKLAEYGMDVQEAAHQIMSLIEPSINAHTEEKVREARNDMYQDLISEASIYYEQGHTFDYEKAMKAYVTNKGKGDK